MLLSRVLTALVGVPLITVAVCAGGYWLGALVTALALVGCHEFCTHARRKGSGPFELLSLLGAGGAVALAVAYVEDLCRIEALAAGALALVLVVCFGSLATCLWRYHGDVNAPVLGPAATTVFAAVYVGVPFAIVVLLRHLNVSQTVGSRGGPWSLPPEACTLLLVVLATWASDSAAYFVGRAWGRTPLSPVSPKKTREGCLGGLIAAVAVAVGAGLWFGLSVALFVAVGLVVGVVGPVGDLCKSALKREMGIKDFGALLPGHGGVLDRFDTLMVNAPVVYFVARLLG